jgi:hypothetical protein
MTATMERRVRRRKPGRTPARPIVNKEPETCGRFRLRIAGDSMHEKWKKGELVEFRCLTRGVEAMVVGKDYYVQTREGATFKRLWMVYEGWVLLHAINTEKYPRFVKIPVVDVVRVGLPVGTFHPIPDPPSRRPDSKAVPRYHTYGFGGEGRAAVGTAARA